MRLSKPVSFTASPIVLLLNDARLFIHITFVWPISTGLPSIMLPFWPFRSGSLDELYPSAANIRAIVLHVILIIAQSGFLLALIPSAFLGIPIPFYTPLYFGSIVFFVITNRWASVLLNGRKQKFCCKVDLTAYPSHDDERWIFINGVAAGKHWLQSNLDRLALSFRRPVYGIHNQTRGIIFDIIECAIQRDLGYDTNDIRAAYEEIVATLSDDRYRKVILVLHSQGAIEGSMVLDWLYATVPSSQVARLEVYTFGNAANHFNAPVQSCLNSHGRRADHPGPSNGDRIVKHIEHYANTGDYVSRFGILHFRPCSTGGAALQDDDVDDEENRFVGRLFKREGMGHQMNGNYLDNIFPMNAAMTEVLECNEFMDGIVDVELVENCDVVSIDARIQLLDSRGKSSVRVKDLSRLWKYRNGMSPED